MGSSVPRPRGGPSGASEVDNVIAAAPRPSPARAQAIGDVAHGDGDAELAAPPMEDADEPPQRAADEQPPEPEVMTISDDGVKDEDAGIPTPEGNWTDDSEDIDDVGLQKALLAELAGGENMEVEDPFQSLCDDMPPACESSAGGSVGDAPAKHASRVAVAMAIMPVGP